MNMKQTETVNSVSLWRRLIDRKAFKIIAGILIFLVLLLYVILPLVLDRIDGTTKPTGTLPGSVALKGQEALPTKFLQRKEGKIAYDDTGTVGPAITSFLHQHQR